MSDDYYDEKQIVGRLRQLAVKNPNQDATLFVKKIESKITFLTQNGTIEVDCE